MSQDVPSILKDLKPSSILKISSLLFGSIAGAGSTSTPGHSMKPTLALRVAWSWRLPSSTAPLLSPIGMEGDATDVGKHEVILQSHSKLGCLGHKREFRHFF
jgi:hypothetical protein